MQRIIGIVLVLSALGWLAGQLPGASPSAPTSASASVWRRTCDGWERSDWLANDLLRQPPAVHPAVFGLGLAFFAVAGLIGLTPEPKMRNDASRLPGSTKS